MRKKTKDVGFYLEAIEGHKEPQDVVGALKDSEDSQIPHHSLHSRVLREGIQKDDERLLALYNKECWLFPFSNKNLPRHKELVQSSLFAMTNAPN